MKKILLIIFIFNGIFTSCQTKETKPKSQMEKIRLIDGMTLDNSIFNKNDIDLNKFKYESVLIENLNISDLKEKTYRENFIKYLSIVKSEDDNFKSTLLVQLLIIRMIQLSDSDAFYILSEISKNDNISYNGIELYQETLLKFFIENPTFFIQQGSKYNDTTIIKNIAILLGDFFANKDFFRDNMASINLENNQLLIYPEKEEVFNNSFKAVLKNLPKIEVIFFPSSYTAWENKTIYFTNIYSLFGEKITAKFSVKENIYYKSNILPLLKKYVNNENYIIEDSDGYTNLRKEKSSTSIIIEKIKSGDKIEVIDNSEDWWLVHTNSGNEGYVYKTKIKSE